LIVSWGKIVKAQPNSDEWMSPNTGTTKIAVSVLCTLSLDGGFSDVKALEAAIVNTAQGVCRDFYAQAMAAFQTAWLEERRDHLAPVRWRSINHLTPFGLLRLPVRVVQDKSSGRYHTLSKVLWRGKATRLLSPALEQQAIELATEQNYRPATRTLGRWLKVKFSHWLIWGAVQYYGAKLNQQIQRGWWSITQRRQQAQVVITEMDSTWIKRQQRGRRPDSPTHFPMHLGLHYTGRTRRYGRRGSTSVQLQNKCVLVSTDTISLFGRRLALAGQRRYRSSQQVLLSDGDEGLERVREKEFPQALWLLDRWHIAQAVRTLVTNNEVEYQRLMKPVWAADSEGVLQALRTSPLRRQRPVEFRDLFGYLLGNREGIDNWKLIPAGWRRSVGTKPAVVKCGSGAVEKNIEVEINRRFKRQGRSWNPQRADHLAQLKRLISEPSSWNRWWKRVCLTTTTINPGWP
jgi:hypothetical protein